MESMDVGAVWGLVSGVLGSIASAGVMYGSFKERIKSLEEDADDLKKTNEKFVTRDHFDTAIEPVKEKMSELSQDMKEIMRLLTSIQRKSK